MDEVEEPIRLALSLHAPTDALRSELMPVNDRYPLEDVLAECRRYVALRGRKVYVEYVMLAGVNDSVETAARARADPRPEVLQGEPDPVQPDRDVRRLVARADRALQVGALPRPRPGDRAAHARARHRRGVRAARRDRRKRRRHQVTLPVESLERAGLKPDEVVIEAEGPSHRRHTIPVRSDRRPRRVRRVYEPGYLERLRAGERA